jgi:hypothetical protein
VAVFVFGLMCVLGFWEVESEARSLCPGLLPMLHYLCVSV